MARSLRSRLVLLWGLTMAAAAAVAVLFTVVYERSAKAEIGRQEAVLERACADIRGRYGFYTTGVTSGAPLLDDPGFAQDLARVVRTALIDRPGVEGGLWQAEAGALSPLPAGAPEAALETLNQRAAADEQPVSQRIDGSTQTVVLEACPAGGPIAGVTAWALTSTAIRPGFASMQAALALLLALVLGAAAWLAWIIRAWSRQVRGIERVLAQHRAADLPHLPPTGEPELDRVVAALNETGGRLAEARREAERLSREAASSARLAALGRIAAGMAHEIRNPIAAMRLKAENALAGDEARRGRALTGILDQVDRLDALLGELLAMTQRRPPSLAPTPLPALLGACLARHEELAAARHVALEQQAAPESVPVDAEQMGRVLDNLVLNALQHTPPGGTVRLTAAREAGRLRIVVADTGPGVPPPLRASLFEPFVTSRAAGTGLGLAIAREIVQAHGGTLELAEGPGATFQIELPCPAS